jgi:hypothetical protein
MPLLERRDALKVAGATALVTALTATGSARAQEPPTHAPPAEPAKKGGNAAEPTRPTWYYGPVRSVGAGCKEFTFSIMSDGVEVGFELEHEAREWAAPIVMLAFEKGLPLWATGEPIPHAPSPNPNPKEGFLARQVLLVRK